MLWRKPDLSPLPYLCLAAILAGLFVSRAMPSIAMMVMVGYSVVLTDPRKTFALFFRDRVLVGLWLVFFIYLVSSINSTEDKAFLLERIRLKLPFLAMPVAFTALKNKISEKQFFSFLFLFLLVVFITSLSINSAFFKNFSNVVHAYAEGRVIETPFSHIRYSLMVAFAIICGCYLFIKKFYFRFKWERWLVLAASLFLIYFLHLLAVRSGIVALYLCSIYLVFYFLLRKKKVKEAAGMMALIIVIPVLAYLLVPTVKSKVQYMQYDLNQLFLFNNASGLSDAGRIVSVEKGYELFKENFFTGVGIGDLHMEMKRKMEVAPENPKETLLPHNQFVFVAAGTGIVGLLLFLAAIALPFTKKSLRRNPLFICFHIIIFSSFFTEATIEEQMGTAFYLTFMLLMYIYFQDEELKGEKN